MKESSRPLYTELTYKEYTMNTLDNFANKACFYSDDNELTVENNKKEEKYNDFESYI